MFSDSHSGIGHRLWNQFSKHHREFSRAANWNVRQYEWDARRLVRWHEASTRLRENQRTVYYNPYTNEFAVTEDGRVLTYLIPRLTEGSESLMSRASASVHRPWRLQLTEDERAAAQSYLIERAEQSKLHGPHTVEALLHAWHTILTQIASGYAYSEDDYTNDLVLRDLIEDVSEMLSSPSRAALREIVDQWDVEFEILTRQSSRPLYYLFGTVQDVAKPAR